MGDLSNEPSMEDILSSIKRIIAEEGDGGMPARGRRAGRLASPPEPVFDAAPDDDEDETVLELDHPVPSPRSEALAAPRAVASEATTADARPDHADAILSARTTEATRGQLDALSRLIVKPEVAGGDSLEGLVREMLRPMMSLWLDENLPRIVETIVAREIARIAGRSD